MTGRFHRRRRLSCDHGMTSGWELTGRSEWGGQKGQEKVNKKALSAYLSRHCGAHPKVKHGPVLSDFAVKKWPKKGLHQRAADYPAVSLPMYPLGPTALISRG